MSKIYVVLIAFSISGVSYADECVQKLTSNFERKTSQTINSVQNASKSFLELLTRSEKKDYLRGRLTTKDLRSEFKARTNCFREVWGSDNKPIGDDVICKTHLDNVYFMPGRFGSSETEFFFAKSDIEAAKWSDS